MSKQPQGVSFHSAFKLKMMRSIPNCRRRYHCLTVGSGMKKLKTKTPNPKKIPLLGWVSVGKKLLQVSLQWLFAERKHKMNYRTKTIPF